VAAVIAVAIGVSAVVAVNIHRIWQGGKSGTRGSGLAPEFTYDISELRRVDPALIGYDEAMEIELPFAEVRAVAAGPGDEIYVAADSAIAVFDASGGRLRTIELAGRPRCLAVASDGTVYVGMRDHVEVIDAAGKVVSRWPSLGERAVVASVAVAGENVFVADAGGRVVLRCDRTGKVTGRIGQEDSQRKVPGLVLPSAYLDVAVGPDGLLRVTNTGLRRVEVYTFDGDLEFAWGRSSFSIEGFSGCCNPIHLAVLADGRVVTSEKGLERVKVYKPDSPRSGGELECVVYSPESFSREAVSLDIATDGAGRVLVADPTAKSIRVFVRKESFSPPG